MTIDDEPMTEPMMTRDQFVRMMNERKRSTFLISKYFNWFNNDEDAIVYCRDAAWRIVRSKDDGTSGTVWYRADDPEGVEDDEDLEEELEFVDMSRGPDFVMIRVVATSSDDCPCTCKFIFDSAKEIPGTRIEQRLELVKD